MEVAASAVAFGTVIGQLAVVSVRLKHLWDDVTEVPERIQESLAEIEHMRLLFADMESSVRDPAYPNLPLSFWTGPLMQYSLERANRALVALETVTEDMSSRLRRRSNGVARKLVALRGLMDKEKIQALEKKLLRSVDLLWKSYDVASKRLVAEKLNRLVAHTVQVEVLHTGQHGIGSNEAGQRTAETGTEQTDVAPLRRKVVSRNSSKPLGRGLLRWHFPRWWSTTVWELCYAPQPGWDYGLRVYSIVPNDSAIIRSIEYGDVDKVVELFRRKQASPYDRDEEGNSLLQLAIRNSTPNLIALCTELVHWGLSNAIHDSTDELVSPFDFAVYWGAGVQHPNSAHLDLLQLFWPYSLDADSVLEDTLLIKHRLGGSTPLLHDFSPQFKFSRIRDLCWNPYLANVDLTWVSDPGIALTTEIALSVDSKISLVHSAAVQVGTVSTWQRWTVFSDRVDIEEAYGFSRTITASAASEHLHCSESISFGHPHGIDLWKGTPLMWVLGGALSACEMVPKLSCRSSQLQEPLRCQDKTLRKAFRTWIRNLEDAAVDLLAYGLTEQANLRGDVDDSRGCFDANSFMIQEGGKWDIVDSLVPIRLLDLKFGSRSEHWELVFVFEFEAMAREFWDTVERLPVLMPGSWVE